MSRSCSIRKIKFPALDQVIIKARDLGISAVDLWNTRCFQRKCFMQVRKLKGTFLGLFNWELLAISWLLLTYLGCGPDIAEVRKRSGVRYERNHRHITGNSFLEGQMTDLTSESFVHDQQLYSTAVYFCLQPSFWNRKSESDIRYHHQCATIPPQAFQPAHL